jgi:methionyl-tRNA synthetase
LLNNLGNFVNRIIKFVNAKFDGVVPEYDASYTDDTFDFVAWRKELDTLLTGYVQDMETTRMRQGLDKAITISSHGNTLLQYRMDNASLEGHPQRTHAIIGVGLNLCSLVASIFHPFMPVTSESICKQLNIDLQLIPDTFSTDVIKAGHKIGKAAYLFSRIDEKKMKEWKEKYGGNAETRAAEEAAKKKKLEDKERKKARKAAKKVTEESGPSKEGEAAVPHTVATEEAKELPIREKPEEK